MIPPPPPAAAAVLLASSLRALGIGGGHDLVVAYSGGADSLALLALLAEAKERPAVEAIHIDHGLRPGSAAEAARALEAAARLGLPARSVRVSVEGGGGLEAAARRARYLALAKAAAGRPILTAHTLDDQAETLLLRLARGSGLRGAAGIRRRARIEGGLVLRPLLGVRRAQLHELVAARGLEVVEDPSNLDHRFARNRLRAEVIPALEAIAPGALAALARFADLAADDERWLAAEAREAAAAIARRGGLDAAALAALPLPLRRRIVRAAIEAAAPGSGQGHATPPAAARTAEVLELLDRGGELHLPGGIVVLVRDGLFHAAPGPTGRAPRAPSPPPAAPQPGLLAPGTPLLVDGRLFEAAGPAPMPASPAPDEVWTSVPPPFSLRHLLPGERLPIPGTGHRAASDLLSEARIPREKRAAALLVEAGGRPIWLVDIRPLCPRPNAGETAWRLRASKVEPAG